jgi:hypothetical protein
MKRWLGPMGLAGVVARRQSVQQAAHIRRQRRPRPALVVAALVVALAMAVAAPALAAEPPTVASVEPNTGPATGGTSVTITGTKFAVVTAVRFGSTNATSFRVTSQESITATSPAGTGTVDVTVTTAEGTSATSSADHFTYVPQGGRYKVNGVFLAQGSPRFLTEWGTLKLQTVKGGTASYECRDAEGGQIENPVGGGAGVGKTELFSAYQCAFSACPGFPRVLAEALPWSGVLVEPAAGEIRAEVTGIKEDYQCWVTKAAFEKAARGEAELPNAKNVYVGTQRPKPETGTSAMHPSFLEFGSAAGRLEQEGSENTIQAETESKLKTLGYKEQELISVE